MVVANHAVTIADLREVQGELLPVPEPSEDEHRLVHELRSTLESLNIKNVEEYFHDAIDYRDECLQLFSRGYLSLQDRASAEGLFGRIRSKVEKIVEPMPHPPEEIVDFLGKAHQKYLVNFSIFQSIPDAWSIDQVFPAAPLSRHGEKPTINAQIVDITCDSDGCVDDVRSPRREHAVPAAARAPRPDEKYYLGFFMTGAYQDSLANVHNLFARCHEVILRNPDDDMVLPGSERVELGENLTFEIKMGATCEDVLSAMDFDVERMIRWPGRGRFTQQTEAPEDGLEQAASRSKKAQAAATGVLVRIAPSSVAELGATLTLTRVDEDKDRRPPLVLELPPQALEFTAGGKTIYADPGKWLLKISAPTYAASTRDLTIKPGGAGFVLEVALASDPAFRAATFQVEPDEAVMAGGDGAR